MKTKGQVALAVGAGYMLGRTHRMKMALMLAAAGATGRFPGGPRDLLERGTKVLANSPEFAKISDSVRQELVSAAKAAAVTAASQRINQLNNRILSGGGEAVSDVGDTVDDTVGGVGKSVGKLSSLGKLGRKRRGPSEDEEYDESEVDEEPDEQYAEDDEDYEEPESDEDDGADEEEASDEEEPARRKRPAARRRASSNGSSRPTSRSRNAKSDEDDEEAPTRGRRTRAKATTDSAPVRRGGR